MREIKFRAWDSKKKNWVHCSLPGSGFAWTVSNGQHERTDMKDWQQFTGLKDKNGKEIYEGDIVESDTEEFTGICRGEVKYTGMAFSFIGEQEDGSEWWMTSTNPDKDFMSGIAVIGNIYENPELLKKL